MPFLLLLLTLFTTTPAYAAKKTKVKKLSPCAQYRKDVLEKAIFMDESDPELAPARFVKDEKEALSYIKSYDVSKLGLKQQHAYRQNYGKNCEHIDKDFEQMGVCDNLFQALDYHRGLLYGIKNYGWSKPTIAEGEAKLKIYLNEVAQHESNLLQLIVAVSVAREMVDLGLLPATSKDEIAALQKETELQGNALSEKQKNQTTTCAEQKQAREDEIKVVTEASAKFRAILKK